MYKADTADKNKVNFAMVAAMTKDYSTLCMYNDIFLSSELQISNQTHVRERTRCRS